MSHILAMLRRAGGGFGVALLISGCTSFVPYPESPPLDLGGANPLPNVRTATESLAATRKKVESLRNDKALLDDALRFTGIGAAAGGTAAVVYGAHRDLSVGLGLTAAGAVLLSNIYSSAPVIKLYNDGIGAFQCVHDKGAALIAAAAVAGKTIAAEEAPGGSVARLTARLEELRKTGGNNPAAKKAVAAGEAALARFRGTKLTLARMRDADPHLAGILREMQSKLIALINGATVDSRVSTEAAVAAAKSAFADAAADKQMPDFKAQRSAPAEAVAALAAQVEALAAEVDAIADKTGGMLTGALAGLSAVAKDCTLAAVELQAMAIAPAATEVTLAPGAVYTIAIKGGKAPFAPSWSGTAPEGVITRDFDGQRTVRLQVAKDAEGGTYRLVIRELLGGGEAAVAVTIAQPAP